MTNADRLRAWLHSTDTTYTELARRVKTDRRRIARWEAGEARPCVGSAVLLDDATDGAVPVDGWLNAAELAHRQSAST